MVERTVEYIRDAKEVLLHILERVTEYYDDGRLHLKEIRLVVDGQISGYYRGYWPSGTIKFRHHYSRGQLNGAYYDYDERGKIITRLLYCSGNVTEFKPKESSTKVLNRYGLQEMLEWLKQAKKPFDYLPGGFKVHTNSNRLKLFRRTQTCVACGIHGDHFQLNWTEGDKTPHLNMYATNKKNGASILMTRDHIIPQSRWSEDRKGVNGLTNSQVMCCKCNGKKGNKKEEELAPDFWKGRKAKQLA